MRPIYAAITLTLAFVFTSATAATQTDIVALSALFVGARLPVNAGGRAQDAHLNGVWVDPATGLMWAAKDNGKDLSWGKAMKYCRNLRLAGYSDWRLANLAEMQGIFDPAVESPGLGKHEIEPTTWHVKGGLFLTAFDWSSNYILDDRGHPSGYAYYFDFNSGRSTSDQKGYSTFKHALCVRGSAK